MREIVCTDHSPIHKRQDTTRKIGSLLSNCRLAVAPILVVFGIAGVSAETKITIGVAAMSPRTIPLLIAQERGLFASRASKRASCASKARRLWWLA
jgi:hypothetical protein